VRRLGRYILNAATVLSLVLCAATVVLWARSFFVQDVLFLHHGRMEGAAYRSTRYTLQSVRGHTVFQSFTLVHQPPVAGILFKSDQRRQDLAGLTWSRRPTNEFGFNYNPDVRGRPLLVRLGFRFARRISDLDPPGRGYTEARVPHWLFAVVTAILPARFLWAARRKRRLVLTGLCPACGYDLRATPERSPECGTLPTNS
jgi:hypothetical protein